MDDPHQAAIDKFPEAYARTQRFAAGAPRNLSVLGDAKKVSNNTDAETQTETSSGDTNRGDVNPGNGRVLFLRAASSTDPTLCLWTLEVDSGSETLLFDPRNLEQAALTEAEKARRERTREAGTGIVSYHLDRDRTKACFTVSGSLVVVDLETGAAETPPVGGTVFDPRLSPDGNFVAYVDGDCLRLLELGNPGSDRVLISDSIQGISYGRADFVAAEEMGRRRGFWWGPSSTDLIVTKVDERPVNKWWTGDPAHPGQKPATIRYPQAGTRNAHTALLNIVAETGESREIHWDADDHYEYLANVIWQATSPDPDDPEANTNPIIVRQTRDQREVSIAELDLETYSLRTLDTLLDDVWVELIPTCPTRSKFGLLTIEDLWEESPPHNDGTRSLVLNGSAITGESFNVRSIVGLVGDLVIFTASPVPTEIHVYALDLKKASGSTSPLAPQAITNDPGTHSAAMGAVTESTNASASTIAITSAVPETAGSTTRVYRLTTNQQLDGGDPVLGNPASGNPASGNPASIVGPLTTVNDLRETPPITARPLFISLGTDQLSSAVFLPSNYDGSSPLPVLLDPYGGPHAQRVMKYHNGHLVSQWFAEQGYAVIVTDGSGTPGRGPTWERRVWGDLASLVLEDQLSALDAASVEFEGLDLDRVGIRGWSFGGYLAALGVLRAPDRIHAAVSGAPVTSWRLYDTHYTERYLGHPEQYPHHYEQTDLIAEAANLTRPLLLIHGLSDDNVLAAHTLRLSSALLAAGRSHQVLPLSGVTHMTPQKAVAENLLRLQLEFLNEHVRDRSVSAEDRSAAMTGSY